VTNRILSQHGNVIAADFRPKGAIEFKMRTQILYADDAVCLARVTYLLDEEVIGTQHITVEAPTI
jgi:hypothetical protein